MRYAIIVELAVLVVLCTVASAANNIVMNGVHVQPSPPSAGTRTDATMRTSVRHPSHNTPSIAPCIHPSTPVDELCYATRCMHLFDRDPFGRLIPTPQPNHERQFSEYLWFGCNVTSAPDYETAPYSAQATLDADRRIEGTAHPVPRCVVPICYCKYSKDACYPTVRNNCNWHTCPKTI